MRQNRLLLLLALLMTVATGAWATPNSIVINGTPQVGDKSISLTYHFDPANVTGLNYGFFPSLKVKCAADNKWDEMPLSLTEVSSGTTIISLSNLGEFEAGKTYEVCFAYNNGNWVDDVFQSFVPAAPVTYTVSLNDGTENPTTWTASTDGTNFGALPIGGLKGDGSETVTLKYNGRLKVKSVTATSDAVPAAPAFAADEYNEASWDGTKVVFEKKKATTTPVAVADAATNVTWGDGWYTVSGNVTITGNVTLGADTYLILQDGATLTINGILNCTNNYNLYIYGQKKGDGKLNVTNNSGIAISSNKHIDIHGGEVTAEATGSSGNGLNTGYLAVYGGKLTATSGGVVGIGFGNTIDVYGGEVVATSNATSSSAPRYGIQGSSSASKILTVYGGKVTATGNGKESSGNYGSGFGCNVMSGTSGIKFYFSADGTTWGDGTSYTSATKVGLKDADAATKKRYAKAE